MKSKIFIGFLLITELVNAQNLWTQKADVSGAKRYGAVGFSIGMKGYVGTGVNWSNGSNYNDFWEYDPSTNVWTQKANFGGAARSGAVGFSIGSKGYIGTGDNGVSTSYKDFWEYDPASNAWTAKANFGGTARYDAVGFAINDKGYIGTGLDVNGNYGNKDFWEYDPSGNTWTSKANFSGVGRYQAVGFSIGSKGYLGTGESFHSSTLVYYNDFWEYNPLTNAWTQKANFTGNMRVLGVGFSIGNKGYLGAGSNGSAWFREFWEYDSLINTWTPKADFGGIPRVSAIGFSIGNKGYIGSGGYGNPPSTYTDFWEYSPGSAIGINEPDSLHSILVYPNPIKEKITIEGNIITNSQFKIYDSRGNILLHGTVISQRFTIDMSKFNSGIYFLIVNIGLGQLCKKIIKE